MNAMLEVQMRSCHHFLAHSIFLKKLHAATLTHEPLCYAEDVRNINRCQHHFKAPASAIRLSCKNARELKVE